MEVTNASSTENYKTTLLTEKHKQHIKLLDEKKDSFEYWVMEHLKVSGVYWGIAAMDVMNSLSEMNGEKIVEFIVSCQKEDGGFGGNEEHDSHLLYTLSAIQVLAMLDALGRVKTDAVVKFVSSLQKPDGSFSGDQWGEIDTRFSYCAICCLSLLGRIDAIDLNKAVDFIVSCRNFDGGFGAVPGAESHAGQIFLLCWSLVNCESSAPCRCRFAGLVAGREASSCRRTQRET